LVDTHRTKSNYMQRALTPNDILNKKYKLFEFDGEWFETFDKPERTGIWFIWGNSGNGKTRFTMQLAKYLTRFGNVIYDSLEEGLSHTVRRAYEAVGMNEVGNKILIVEESIEDLCIRLDKQRSADIVFIDSFQHSQLTYKEYLIFRKKYPRKLIIFISQAEGAHPEGRPAKRVMFDAKLKIWVEGFKAFSKGRYIGKKEHYVIWEEGAYIYDRKFNK